MVKMLKYPIILLISLFVLVGCSSQGTTNEKGSKEQSSNSSESNDKLTIGVSIQGFKGLFTNYIRAGIMDYAEELGNVEVIVVDAEDRSDKQIGQVENFISQGVDAIILNPVDRVTSAPAIDAAVKANIPIITVNTSSENQDKATAFVGSDDVEAGKIQMEYIAEKLGKKGNVAILHGALGHSAQIGRMEGYTTILNQNQDMKLAFEQSADWQTDKALSIVENWLLTGTKIDAIATNSDTMALGAQVAIDSANKSGEIIVMGMDAIPEMLERIKTGKISGTIWQDGIAQGKYSLDLAVKAANGEDVEDMFIPYELVTQDNIDEYLKKAEGRDELSKKYN